MIEQQTKLNVVYNVSEPICALVQCQIRFWNAKWLKNLNLQYLGDWELTEYQFRSQLSLGPPAKNSYDILILWETQ